MTLGCPSCVFVTNIFILFIHRVALFCTLNVDNVPGKSTIPDVDIDLARDRFQFDLPTWNGINLEHLAVVLENKGVRGLRVKITSMMNGYYKAESMKKTVPHVWEETLEAVKRLYEIDHLSSDLQ